MRDNIGRFAKGRVNENKGKTKRINICVECGKEFIRKTLVKNGVRAGQYAYSKVKYCDEHKSMSFGRSMRGKGRETACKDCGEKFQDGVGGKRIYCIDCRHKPRPAWNKGKISKKSLIKKLHKVLKKRLVTLTPRKKRAYISTKTRIRKTPLELQERKRFRNQRYRISKRNAEGSHTFDEWLALKAFYKNMCLCCKRQEPEIKLTEDHIMPISMGGTDYIGNIQPLCVSCNTRKHARFIDYREEVKTISLVN